jgi:uncharacterized paraquat-inducible protein A
MKTTATPQRSGISIRGERPAHHVAALMEHEGAMRCPNCQAWDPTPPLSDNGTTTCPKCGHRFPVEETVDSFSIMPGAVCTSVAG